MIDALEEEATDVGVFGVEAMNDDDIVGADGGWCDEEEYKDNPLNGPAK